MLWASLLLWSANHSPTWRLCQSLLYNHLSFSWWAITLSLNQAYLAPTHSKLKCPADLSGLHIFRCHNDSPMDDFSPDHIARVPASKGYCPICCQILPGSSPGGRLVKWLIGGESLVYVSLMSESDLLNDLRMEGLVSFSSPPGLEGDDDLCLPKIQLFFRWTSSGMQGRSQQTNFSSN